MKYKPVIGLEVHVELKTKSKMFCSCKAEYFGDKPNANTCPVCLGLPGALPVPNEQAIKWAVCLGLALNCDIPLFSKFDRKNYFYPDLPKGYQISQYDQPFARNGSLKIKDKKSKIKNIRIRRVHMEEDTAKLIHKTINGEKMTLIDFNRSGVPLVEIVTEPDFENATEVKLYLQKLQQIVRYLEISDADMEKGQMRLEPNISIAGSKKPYRVEVKNINSFNFVDKAIKFELDRQKELIDKGETPLQETRGWDEKKQQTVLQRVKETASDYRYFPEPDIPPVRWNKNQISNIKNQIPEMPDDKFVRFKKQYKLTDYQSEILTREKSVADYFEDCLKVGEKHNVSAKQIANFIINKKNDLANILPAKVIEEILKLKKKEEIDINELTFIVQKVLKDNPRIKEDYKKGKESVIQFAIGQVMYILRKKIDTEVLRKLIMEELK